MSETQKHTVEVDLSMAGFGVLFLALVFAMALSDGERATQQAAIQKCWNLGGVPVFAWYSTGKLADCRFK